MAAHFSAAIINGADPGNGDPVFIAGRAMKRNGRLVNFDIDRAYSLPSRRTIPF